MGYTNVNSFKSISGGTLTGDEVVISAKYIAYSLDANVYIHSREDLSLTTTLTQSNYVIGGMAISSSGDYIAYGEGRGGEPNQKVYIHSTGGNWPLVKTIDLDATTEDESVKSLDFSGSDTWLAIATSAIHHQVYIHQVSDWGRVTLLQQPTIDINNAIRAVEFGNENWVFYTTRFSNLYAHDTSDWSLSTTLSEEAGWAMDVTFFSYGQIDYVGYIYRDGAAYVHSVGGNWPLETTLTQSDTTTYYNSFISSSNSHDPRFIAYGGTYDKVYIHTFGGGGGLYQIISGDSYGSLGFAPDDKMILIGNGVDNVFYLFLLQGHIRYAIDGVRESNEGAILSSPPG